MRIFVTGGAGFIGKHLVNTLLEKNYEVIVFDKQILDSNEILSNKYEKFQLIKGDITDFKSIVKAVDNIDTVIHLAAKISVEESIKNPQETFDVNVQGTINLLEVCSKKNIKKFIAISSAAVYDNSNKILFEDSLVDPISPYGKSKLLMEKQIIDFSKKFGINSIILRLFNVYGKGQSLEYAGVISKFIENVIYDRPLVIYGDGKQTRDFVSVQDVVDAIINSIYNIEGKHGKIYNIGIGRSIQILDIAEAIIKTSKKDLPIQFKKSKKGDIFHSKTSIELAKKEISYNPKIELKEEIKKLLKDTLETKS